MATYTGRRSFIRQQIHAECFGLTSGAQRGSRLLINCLGSFQNGPRSFWNDLNHVTLRRSVPRRPGRARWLRWRPRTDGRVEVCAKSVPTLVGPRTFEQCVIKEEHSHQTFGQWRRHRSGVQSGLPSTTLVHVRCECHATTTHITAAVEGVC